MDRKIKVMLVEDDTDFAFLIQKIIDKDKRLNFVGHAARKKQSIEMARELNPDVVLMDLNLSNSELDGIEAAREIRLTTDSKVILLTSFEQEETVLGASKQSFASGYIFKSHHMKIADTVYETAVSKTPQELFIKELLLSELTTAERAVMKYLLEGDEYMPASSSAKTIANQKTNIFKKLGLRNTDELINVFKNW